ncbi:hypothetical protein [Paenibacillus glacialis]|uniref:Uncharacterized protein n=1 Tax=Paenibacillus glacialis TaxID=494026 RepID=A0A169ZGD6_9BACL|nr:hypothetical protein [Paenibacillus glacialis]OAB39785.1 hypothetical protein PGLA_18910 [Paenibacillus glacialis]
MEITFKTIYPRAKLNILTMMLFEGCLLTISINQDNLLTYFISFLMLIVLVYIIAIIKRMFFTKLSITLETDYVISSNGKKYESSRIESIYMSYKRIGSKVQGKRLVPMDLCFYFDKSQEMKGLEKLNEWAEHNKKEVKNKFFQTLM